MRIPGKVKRPTAKALKGRQACCPRVQIQHLPSLRDFLDQSFLVPWDLHPRLTPVTASRLKQSSINSTYFTESQFSGCNRSNQRKLGIGRYDRYGLLGRSIRHRVDGAASSKVQSYQLASRPLSLLRAPDDERAILRCYAATTGRICGQVW